MEGLELFLHRVSGYGYGYGVRSIEGHLVHRIDRVPTIITNIKGNIARGYILQSDLSLIPCYVVKERNTFAHGNTLRDAFDALHKKLLVDSPIEYRVEKFIEQFPHFDTPYPARQLFDLHHTLTGSCLMGRESFCKSHCIDINKDTFTIRQFCQLTQDQYNGDAIKKLQEEYKLVIPGLLTT